MALQDEIFEESFNEAVEMGNQSQLDTDENKPTIDLSRFMTPLSTELQELFDTADRARRDQEEVWITDLRQYKGIYEPEVLSRMNENRSKAFIRLTRTKVKTLNARMLDIFFPSNGARNWDLKPTPVPFLDPQFLAQVYAQQQEVKGAPLTPEEQQLIVADIAEKRADKMRLLIDDQLGEFKYRDVMRKVLHSGHLYGTGVMKGPLVKEKVDNRWVRNPQGTWDLVADKSHIPYAEHVPVWDVYPDMSATKVDDLRYVFQRHIMNRNQVYLLSKRSDFNGPVLEEILEVFPMGKANSKNFEQDLYTLSSDEQNTEQARKDGKYEIIEFWGYVNAKKLREEGVELDASIADEIEIAANVWMVDNIIIKAVVSPIDAVDLPYYFYHFDKDETSIWGEGVASVMRDPQELYNASVRALLDNAAIAAGPLVEANLDLLAQDEDPTDISPFRVMQRTGSGMEAGAPALRVTNLSAHTTEFMAMASSFREMGDEVTAIPRLAQGDVTDIGSAGRSPTGLSMIMGTISIGVKDLAKNIDDNITKPFIKALYFYNMDFATDPDVKGDYSIDATGTTSLVAKELRLEHLTQALNVLSNDKFFPYLNIREYLLEFIKAMDLEGMNLIKTQEQIAVDMQRAEQERQRMEQRENELEMMKIIQSSKHSNPMEQGMTPAAMGEQGG